MRILLFATTTTTTTRGWFLLSCVYFLYIALFHISFCDLRVRDKGRLHRTTDIVDDNNYCSPASRFPRRASKGPTSAQGRSTSNPQLVGRLRSQDNNTRDSHDMVKKIRGWDNYNDLTVVSGNQVAGGRQEGLTKNQSSDHNQENMESCIWVGQPQREKQRERERESSQGGQKE